MVAAGEPVTDHWAVLGLDPGADADALKRAFRQQARRWHPDLNGNDPVAEERFKQVNEAYAVLSDPRRRRAWEGGEPDAGGDGRSSSRDPFASGFPSFEAYLEVLFGRRRREPAASEGGDPQRGDPQPGPAAQPHVPEAGPGGGVTAAPPSPPPVTAAADSETIVELSPEQALEGERVELELADGTVVEVWTPPLAGDGWRLRLAGVTPGGGDHFLQLRVRTPEGLRVDGLRVLFQLPLSPAEAVLGCRVVVPTLRGPVQLTVPPGSSSGRLLRLRGRGLEWGELRGDQLVEVRIVVPEESRDDELALYRRLLELAEDA
ncbi:MAG: J domain-containing protein [Cyanobium sp. PLM2.Bin73]|nr:MAG: J domain-containing protein [Cyanobium sp. PLM2.Bin73]